MLKYVAQKVINSQSVRSAGSPDLTEPLDDIVFIYESSYLFPVLKGNRRASRFSG